MVLNHSSFIFMSRFRIFRARLLRATVLLMLSLLCATHATAASSVFCDQKLALTGGEKNQLLNFSDVVRRIAQDSGGDIAIISRSGIDLERFNIRYSHAGFVLKNPENDSWFVRQLYYGCDEAKPSIYDQGLAGFLLDHDTKSIPFVSLVFIPSAQRDRVEAIARSKTLALDLLGPRYSANAYPFSTEFQNCNQWLMEMLAYAWGNLETTANSRNDAQAWLKANGYQPSQIDVHHRYIVWAGHFIPLIHNSDQPDENLEQNLYEVSMPASIETFVKNRVPGAKRVELCLKQGTIVVHRGWDMISDNCDAVAGDEVLSAY